MVLRGAISFTQDASRLRPMAKTTRPPKCATHQNPADHFKSVLHCGHGALLGNPAAVEKALSSLNDICLPQVGHCFANFKDVDTAALVRCLRLQSALGRPPKLACRDFCGPHFPTELTLEICKTIRADPSISVFGAITLTQTIGHSRRVFGEFHPTELAVVVIPRLTVSPIPG